MFKQLLVPLDLSPVAEQALGPACTIARAAGASIDVVVAKARPPYSGNLAPSWHADADKAEREYVRHTVEEIARGASVTVSGSVMGGQPVDVILQRVRELSADLVVMTSHGRTGISRAWMGSVADGVVHHLGVPVLLLRAREHRLPRRNPSFLFERILIALDGSPAATAVVGPAVELAKCSSAKLVLARVVKPLRQWVYDAGVAAYPTPIRDEEATRQATDEARDALVTTAQQLEHESGLRLETVVVVAEHPAAAILGLAKSQRADLVAITSHGRGASRLLTGSVADKILRGSTLPLLVRRPAANP